MRRLFMYASLVGLTAGVVYWMCKKEKNNNVVSGQIDNKMDFEASSRDREISQNTNIVVEMYQVKNENLQNTYERHTDAGEIMKDAYQNIMEDFVEDFSNVNVEIEKDENRETVIDSESDSVMKDIDLISVELDDLLK